MDSSEVLPSHRPQHAAVTELSIQMDDIRRKKNNIKCLGKMLGDHMLLGQLWHWGFWSSDEDEVLRTGSRVQAECKEAGWTATVHPMERKGLCGQIRNPTSHAAGMTEKSSQRAIKATGCGYGGGTVLSLQRIFRGSCRGWQGKRPHREMHCMGVKTSVSGGSSWRPCSWPSVHRQKCSRQRCQAERTSPLRYTEHHSSKRYSLI